MDGAGEEQVQKRVRGAEVQEGHSRCRLELLLRCRVSRCRVSRCREGGAEQQVLGSRYRLGAYAEQQVQSRCKGV